MDKRFSWLRDRVQQKQSVVEHALGQYNKADFSTKALPKTKYDHFHRYTSIVVNTDFSEGKPAKNENCNNE